MGILQTKVYYEWGTWPMIKDSTAFNADYRYADQRACMNGDYAGYFASTVQQPNTYAADIASGNIDRVLWGCIGMHYSGGYYAPQSLALTYPAFWTRDTKEVAKLGDVTIQSHENVLHFIPPIASIGAIVIGGGLILAGVVLKGRD